MDQYVVCLNAGSSSLKFAVYNLRDLEAIIMTGSADMIGLPSGRLKVDLRGSTLQDKEMALPTHEGAVLAALSAMSRANLPTPIACVHRVVHGGPDLINPVVVDEEVRRELERLVPLAPLHIPNELKVIDVATRVFPRTPQVACFDTAFHQRMPAVAKRLALPRKYGEMGIRRYGFHGISYESIVSHLGNELSGRSIVAHLGNGCSMVALRDGIPQDTTMALTPTGGLMMGTRSGDLDPGVLFYLMRQPNGNVRYATDQVENLVNHESGLLGVSGTSRNMKELLNAETESISAQEAIELFCYSANKFLGALCAVLGGLDTLVFAGGIGENSPEIRRRICERAAFLNVRLDSSLNEANAPIISHESSACIVRMQHTDETLMMARHALDLLPLILGKGAA